MSGEIYSKEWKVKADSRVVFSQVDIEARRGGFFSLMIVDPDSEMYRLKVDMESGNSKFLVHSTKAVDKVISTKSSSNASNIIQLRSNTRIPKSGFRMKVQPVIDLSFQRRFGGNSQQKVNEIFEFVKAVFLHTSLTTKYKLDVASIRTYNGYLQDQLNGSGLRRLGSYVQSLPLANSYAAITYKRVTGSFVAGVAYLGKVCASKRERVNINLYYSDASEVAETVAHEIGHNLNMDHDFKSDGSGQRIPKSSSDGRPCTNKNFIMDYYQPNPRSWSPCSVEDINRYYRATGGYGNNCMQALNNNEDPVECNDKNRWCNYWANAGFCTGYYETWMGNNCKKSCNLCGNGGNCKDQNRNCNYWANQGFCKGRYEQWMGENCQKSCALC